MRYLSKYNESNWVAKQHEYSIYDWFEDLKRDEWSNKVGSKATKMWCDHFIGDGYWDKINNLVDKMFTSLSKVDIDNINDRMFDVYDEIPLTKTNYTMTCVAYGDWNRYDDPSTYKYSGMISIPDTSKKEYVISHIIKAIVYPTLWIGTYPSANLRRRTGEIYVLDPRWNCSNFNIDNFSLKLGDVVLNSEKNKKVVITDYQINEKRKYSAEKVLSMYKPCIGIFIGGHDGIGTGAMNLKKLESDIDEVLPSILPDLDYDEVIFDMNRGSRQYGEDTDIYDYTLKILLKL